MHPSAFFPSMTFFLAISARSCAPFQFFTLQDLVRGECDVWFFYEHDLAFVPFSFFHPLHVGEQSVEYPQGVISIPTYKSRWLFTATYTSSLGTTHFTYVANNAVVLGCARTSSLSECAHQLCASKQ